MERFRGRFRRQRIRLRWETYVGRKWYFVTICTEGRASRFSDARLVDEVLETLVCQARVEYFAMQAYCFLPDHLHLLVSGTHDDSDLQVFVVGFKQRSAYAFRRKTGQRLWQYNYYDHVLQPDERWESVACYIWLNPVRKGLCERAESWPFSGSQTLDWRKLMTVGAAVWIPPWKKGVGPKA